MQFLSPQDIAGGDLQKYDVILLGVRAYTARPELATNNNRLLEYVQNGGVVVVQYQSVQYDHNFGPYPYSSAQRCRASGGRTLAGHLRRPEKPAAHVAQQINQSDFAGWVEERGHSFMKSWDRTMSRRSKRTIQSRTRKRVAWFTRDMGAEFTSMWPLRCIGSCRMACRARTGCLPIY